MTEDKTTKTVERLASRLEELESQLDLDTHEATKQFEEPEVQLAPARMETVEAFRERKKGIIKSLNAMENTMRKIERRSPRKSVFPQWCRSEPLLILIWEGCWISSLAMNTRRESSFISKASIIRGPS